MSRAFRGYVNEWELEREQGGLFAGQGEVDRRRGHAGHAQPACCATASACPGSAATRSTPTERSASNPFERDVEAEYRLNRFFYVTTELTQRRTPDGTSRATSTAARLQRQPQGALGVLTMRSATAPEPAAGPSVYTAVAVGETRRDRAIGLERIA